MEEKKPMASAGGLPIPIEGEDYYVENGCWVFTAAYHVKRGYCCGSGCRHCPYGEKGTGSTDDKPTKKEF